MSNTFIWQTSYYNTILLPALFNYYPYMMHLQFRGLEKDYNPYKDCAHKALP